MTAKKVKEQLCLSFSQNLFNMDKTTILYVEDDETLGYLTTDSLKQNSYTVIHCKNGEEAFNTFKIPHMNIDVCILDIMMPKMDGFELAEKIRERDKNVPIIFLSAKTLKDDKIRGLRLGADDYIVKPFSIEELVLKIEIFINRPKKNDSENKHYKIGSFNFNYPNYELINTEKKIKLTQKEADLLKLFIENKNQVLKREHILINIWGDNDYFLGRSLDVFISRLRKIFASETGIKIENIHGIGFKYIDLG